MEITGKVALVLPIASGTSKSGNAWQKREFVIQTAGQYPKKVCLQLFGERVNECPSEGDDVKVSFDAESREYNGRWYTQLNAWKVEKQGAPQPLPAAVQTSAPANASAPAPNPEDDIPF